MNVCRSTYIDDGLITTPHGVQCERYNAINWTGIAMERLTWLYGFDRAWNIFCGRDPETEADIAAWRRLGRKKRP